MSVPRIFITRRLAIDPVSFAGPGVDIGVFEGDRAPSPAELVREARGAAGLVSLLSDRIDGALLDALGGLRVVANHAVGVDNIDLEACAARGVVVTHTPDVLTAATAELTWAILLSACRRLREGEGLLRGGGFGGWAPTMLLGRGLSGRTLGVFGFGRIGRAVARAAPGFGMRTLVTSRRALGPGEAAALGVTEVAFDELLARSDILTIHCPLVPETRRAFGPRALAAMKRGAVLVNTARGPIVDEAALVAALDSGHLGGAALDVFEREPEVHPGLLGRDDVVLLPHLGSATVEARRSMAELALGDALRVVRGLSPLHPYPPPA